ncbi:MAG: hypothetical protein APF81_27085 [Desulfosporosinus sp. BRH_c37]|nr:MAG: hypothetical protein APF81_27085 [Desulfosporosinus sp. BRH_c37]
MAFFMSEINSAKQLLITSSTATISLARRFSLSCAKGIVVGFLLCSGLVFFFLWQPTYVHVHFLEKEKANWLNILDVGVASPKSNIPSMDQLPAIIGQCRESFVKEGINVVSIYVERFGEQKDTKNGASLDYALVRLHLRGNWKEILTSLKTIEDMQEVSIHVQEVTLADQSGETLFQVYFRTGE